MKIKEIIKDIEVIKFVAFILYLNFLVCGAIAGIVFIILGYYGGGIILTTFCLCFIIFALQEG